MKHSKSGLFLMELIIALLFFSLASSVAIRLFVKSYLISQQTINENHAVNEAQNLAEGFLGTEGDLAALGELFPEGILEAETLTLYWNQEWEPCLKEDASYAATLTSQPDTQGSGLIGAEISLEKLSSQEVIYHLHVDHHVPERRAS